MVIATDVLAGLDNVAWDKLHHAYGTAVDVPIDLRSICGGDAEARRTAFSNLSNNICHQGSRYAASPFAVPFLARIAVAGPEAARVDALGLLKMLAVDWHDEYEPRWVSTQMLGAVLPSHRLRPCGNWTRRSQPRRARASGSGCGMCGTMRSLGIRLMAVRVHCGPTMPSAASYRCCGRC
jgi:hypothetical protein